MPLFEREERWVILNQKCTQVIDVYKQAFAKYQDKFRVGEATELTLDHGTIHQDWKVKLFAVVDLAGGKYKLPAISKDLSQPASIVVKDYIRYLHALCAKENKTAKHTSETEIDDIYVLTTEFLTRLVVFALCEEENIKADGEILLNILEFFVDELTRKNILNKKNIFNKKSPSFFDIEFSTDHKHLLNDIKAVVNTVKKINIHKKVLSNTLDYLKCAENVVIRQIIIKLNQNKKIQQGQLYHDQLEENLAKLENQLLGEFKPKTSHASNQQLIFGGDDIEDPEFKHTYERCEQICQAFAGKNKAKKEEIDQLVKLYILYIETARFQKKIVSRNSAITLTGWVLILTGTINIEQLKEDIVQHSQMCQILDLKSNDPVFKSEGGLARFLPFSKPSAGAELIRLLSTSSTQIAAKAQQVLNDLNQLTSEKIRQELIARITHNIIELQKEAVWGRTAIGTSPARQTIANSFRERQLLTGGAPSAHAIASTPVSSQRDDAQNRASSNSNGGASTASKPTPNSFHSSYPLISSHIGNNSTSSGKEVDLAKQSSLAALPLSEQAQCTTIKSINEENLNGAVAASLASSNSNGKANVENGTGENAINTFAKEVTEYIFSEAKRKLAPNKDPGSVLVRKYHSWRETEEYEDQMKIKLSNIIKQYLLEKNIQITGLDDQKIQALKQTISTLLVDDIFYKDFYEKNMGSFWRSGCIRVDYEKIDTKYIFSKLNEMSSVADRKVELTH